VSVMESLPASPKTGGTRRAASLRSPNLGAGERPPGEFLLKSENAVQDIKVKFKNKIKSGGQECPPYTL
jgi:hypothetical protein